MPRDLINFFPDIRVDLPDFTAHQRNARSEARGGSLSLLYGEVTDAFAQKTFGGWLVEEDSGGPSSQVEITAGRGTGLQVLPGGTNEQGVMFGALDGPALQVIDLTGFPVNTYSIWVRFKEEPGEPGARVFWNPTGGSEEIDNIDTRLIITWDVVAATASPGVEWQEIAEVVWNGATVANGDITHKRDMFFEGDEDGGFAQVWGDGVNDRDTDRGTYGIGDLYTWSQAVRRQLTDILGGDWFTVPSTNLVDLFAHINDATDPHGSLLIQTDLTVTNDFSAGTVAASAAALPTFGITSLSNDEGLGGVTLTSTGVGLISGFIISSADKEWQHSGDFRMIDGDIEVPVGDINLTAGTAFLNVMESADVNFGSGAHAQTWLWPGFCFMSSDESGGTNEYQYTPDGAIAAASTGDTYVARLHLDLPHSSTFDQIRVNMDGSAGDTYAIRLQEFDLVSGVASILYNSGTVAMVGGRFSITVTSPTFPAVTVDRRTKAYFLDITMDDITVGTLAKIESARARFTPVSLYPL